MPRYFTPNCAFSALLSIAVLFVGAVPISLAQETPEHVVADQPYPFDSKDTRDKEIPDIEISDELMTMLATLDEADIALLKSGKAQQYVGGAEGIEELAGDFSPSELKAWVDAIRYVIDSKEYKTDRDSANIPLNTASSHFNAWRLKRPRSLDPDRDAGPISLSRPGVGGGPRTFGGLPLALSPEDLIAGEVDVAILGAPLNMGSRWRDSGAQATAELRLFGWAIGEPDQYVLVEPKKVLNMVDYGDVAVDNLSTERSMKHVREIVREIAQTGAVPMIVGGDHSLAYPNVAALADVYGKEKVSVIHFDSHYDAWWGHSAHLISHGYPVYRLLMEGHVRAADYIQVGLRSSHPLKEAFDWMRQQGMRYHTMAEIERRGWEAVIDRVVEEASEEGRKLHISFDIDVIDPAFATATGTPVPGGLTMRESIAIVRRLCSEANVVGFDLVELHPALDPTYKTSLNSAFIIKACTTGLAMRKLGLTDEHYLSPLSSEHALDNYYGDQQKILDATAAEKKKEDTDSN